MSTPPALVETRGQSALTTSLIVAGGCDVQHKNVLALIRKHSALFSELGTLAFETRPFDTPGGVQTQSVALLNEDQATFLMTLLRNTEVVLRFKLTLVKEFRKALNEISRLYANPPRADILKAKRAANPPLNAALVEMLADAGKDPKPHHFSNEARLCNWVVTGSFAAIDEQSLSNEDALLLEQVRDRDRAYLLAGLDYATRKDRLRAFALRTRTRLLSAPA